MIKEVFNSLSEDQRKVLILALDRKEGLLIEYKPQLFIGVNIEHFTNLEITESSGVWAVGKILRKPWTTAYQTG